MKEKSMKKKKCWKGIHHLPQADRCPASLQAMATLQNLPPIFITGHDVTQRAGPLWSAHVSLRAVGAEWETEKALMLCEHCSAVA